jgi:hypothetical protein
MIKKILIEIIIRSRLCRRDHPGRLILRQSGPAGADEYSAELELFARFLANSQRND